jgi:hypothetical protein
MPSTTTGRSGPWPPRGLDAADFRCIGKGGLGDGQNNYAHSMTWYGGKLYLGTTRANMCTMRVMEHGRSLQLAAWPVECPETMDGLYEIDRRAQIWTYDAASDRWDMVFRAPLVDAVGSNAKVTREVGYRAMAVFQGPSDPQPALYVGAWAPGRAPGGLLLRSVDGARFEPVTPYGIIDPPILTTRSLTAFRDRLYFAPTSRRGDPNLGGVCAILGSRDPATGGWEVVNEPNFGEAGNLGVFTLFGTAERLYAGTFNLQGYQVWASECRGNPPFYWDKIIDGGAGRGPLNQAVVSMTEFNGAVYIGGGVQGGGIDRANNIGPAAAEIVRLNPDDSWDLIVGDPRDTVFGRREPLSGLHAGFGDFFNGYIWTLAEHAGWLYAGTYNSAIFLRWTLLDQAPPYVRRLFDLLDPEEVIANQGGADLWRSADGENWLPVTRRGFGNVYNCGVRNLISTPQGLLVGTANLFGPRVAARAGNGWQYVDNPDGGLEVWFGQRPDAA